MAYSVQRFNSMYQFDLSQPLWMISIPLRFTEESSDKVGLAVTSRPNEMAASRVS